MFKLFTTLGAMFMVLAVGLGAFGAHGLQNRLSAEMMEIFQTGVRYHVYHALGLILVGLIATQLPETVWIKWSGWLMCAGIIIFSGSLYLLSTTGTSWLGAITPIGGTAFIIAWILLGVALWKG